MMIDWGVLVFKSPDFIQIISSSDTDDANMHSLVFILLFSCYWVHSTETLRQAEGVMVWGLCSSVGTKVGKNWKAPGASAIWGHPRRSVSSACRGSDEGVEGEIFSPCWPFLQIRASNLDRKLDLGRARPFAFFSFFFIQMTSEEPSPPHCPVKPGQRGGWAVGELSGDVGLNSQWPIHCLFIYRAFLRGDS